MHAIRKLEPSDASTYKELRLSAFQKSPKSFSESFADEQHESEEYFLACMGLAETHFTLGCFSEGHLVGFATFKRDRRSKAIHKSYIHTMYVAPEFRGQKIAGRLLEQLIEHARAQDGLEQIHLWVLNPEESSAKRLYARKGFRSQGAQVCNDLKIDGEYVDAEYMSLFL